MRRGKLPAMRVHLPLLIACALITPFASCAAQDGPELPLPADGATARATTGASVGRFPFLEVDARTRQVRVECEALAVENPLEFFCCLAGTVEHESVLRSKVRPSNLHAALLMLERYYRAEGMDVPVYVRWMLMMHEVMA